MANATDLLENIGKSLTKTADIVAKKTDQFIQIQKLKGKKSTRTQQMTEDFKTIGEIIYGNHVSGEAYSDEITDLCLEITSLRKEIAACKEEISLIRGARVCPSCGSSIPSDAVFCMQCGTRMPEAEEADPDTVEEEAAAETPDAESGEQEKEAEETPEDAEDVTVESTEDTNA